MYLGAMLKVLVRSGTVGIDIGCLWHIGFYGYGWSSTAAEYASASVATVYRLRFDAVDVTPSLNNHRWNGFPLRCLAD